MTFDQWVDAVNAQIHAKLGNQVQTQELDWDSAMWVGPSGTVVASLSEDEKAASLTFDGGEGVSLAFQQAEASPEIVGGTIAARLARH